MMTDLTERQNKILGFVVHDYIGGGCPVGSKRLVNKYKLDVSDATVRNELGILTDKGYLRQPHTSAGRVPTEDGYRHFVSEIMDQTELTATARDSIRNQFYQDGREVKHWFRVAVRLLARHVQAASVITTPISERNDYKHLELINTHGRWVMMILVKEGGEVSQQMLTLAKKFTQEQLSAAAQHLNHLFLGLDADHIDAHPAHYNSLERDIVKLILEDMRQIDPILIGEVYRAGLSHMVSESEFGDTEVARNALRVLEERPLLEELLTSEMLVGESTSLKVLIGGEGRWEALRSCSVVLARYGEPGLLIGTLGVLGPMRMPYRRTISTIRLVADLLSDVVADMPMNMAEM